MTEEVQYPWTDNPTVSGVAECNTDILNDCLMHLKYDKKYDKKEGSGHDLFDLVLKDHNLSFDESKGFALLGTYVYKTGVSGTRYGYPDFINRCIAEKNAGTATQVTLGSSTITMYVNANGHQFYNIADKAAVDTWYNTYGIAWFYGVDEENERVFLPRQDIALLTPKTRLKIYGDGNALALTNDSAKVSCISSLSGYGNAHYYVPTYFTNAFPIGSASGSISQSAAVSNGKAFGVIPKSLAKNGITSGLTSDTLPTAQNKYIYMVVGNTEQQSAITGVVDVTTSENDTIPLFTPMYFDFKPNHPSWLKAGEQANNAGLYEFTYSELVKCLTPANNKYDLKVIDVNDMVTGVDYSEYWQLNQDEMWFKTPTIIAEQSTAQLYFKVANAVQNLEVMNGGAITEVLADKIGRTECKAYITETYVKGTSGYILYSNKWIKQWGRQSASKGTTSVSLLKTMANTNYLAQLTSVTGTNTTAANSNNQGLTDLTTTTIAIKQAEGTYTCSWVVEGYSA